MIPRAFNSLFSNDMKTKLLLHSYFHSSYFAYRGLVTLIWYRGNGKAYTTPTRTLFVYDPFVYPSDIYRTHLACDYALDNLIPKESL